MSKLQSEVEICPSYKCNDMEVRAKWDWGRELPFSWWLEPGFVWKEENGETLLEKQHRSRSRPLLGSSSRFMCFILTSNRESWRIWKHFFPLILFKLLETVSHSVAQAILEFTMQSKTAESSCKSFCLSLPNAGITGVCHHAGFALGLEKRYQHADQAVITSMSHHVQCLSDFS